MTKRPISGGAPALPNREGMTMIKTKTKKTQRVADATYIAFVSAVLEPLPAEILIDTHYNFIARQTRREAWLRADAATCYFKAMHAYIWAASRHYRYEKLESLKSTAEISCCLTAEQLRAAIARQILTPAFDQAGVVWKRAVLADELRSRWPFKYFSITREETEAAIAADEAFLAAHPVRRCRSKKEA